MTEVHRTVEPILEDLHIHGFSPLDGITIDETKQALLKDLLEIIGQDEPTEAGFSNTADLGEIEPEAVRNQLKAELREKIRGYING